jgi:hypothetical protein
MPLNPPEKLARARIRVFVERILTQMSSGIITR